MRPRRLPPHGRGRGHVHAGGRAARPAGRAARLRHRPGRRVHADRRRAGRGHVEDGPDPRGPAGGSPGVGGAGRPQPRPVERACAPRVHLRPRPLVASRPARSGATSTRTPAARTAWRTASRRATCSPWTWSCPDGEVERFGSEAPEAPGYDLRGFVVGSEGTLGIVAASVRSPHAAPARRAHHAARLRHCRRTAPQPCPPSSPAASCPAAVEMMDQRHHRGRRELRPRRLPDRRRRGPARGGRRAPRGRGRTVPRGGGRRPRARRRARSAWPATTPSGPCCGRDARARSAPSPRSRPTTTCTTASCRARSSSRCWPASTRSRAGTTSS